MRARLLILILAAAAPASIAQEPASPPAPQSAPSAPAAAPSPASERAFTLREKDLVPEGIAHDPVTGTFFVGSIQKRKIVAVGPDGVEREFASRGQDGLMTVLGLRVDPARRLLWAMTNGSERVRAEKGRAAAFKYDLTAGTLLKKYPIEDGSREHLFNDLAVARDGTVYISDSDAHAIYRIDPKKDELERFIEPDVYKNLNGLALSDDDRVLFAAHSLGIAVIDTATKTGKDIRTLVGVPLPGIDGLCYYKGSLVAVQNGFVPERIMRFRLSPSFDRVERADLLEKEHPDFSVPTTGVVAGDTFYYIANSQLDRFDEFGRLAPPSRLRQPVILKLKLAP